MGRGKFRRGGGGSSRGHGGGFNRGGKKGRGGGSSGGRQYQDNRQSFELVDKHNEKFERFYNTLNILPAGPERDAFWQALRRELPNSFRFTGSRSHALGVRDNLVQRFFPMLERIKHNDAPIDLPKPMPWYPEGLAYSMTTPKNVVRKYEPFKEFQKFLVSETGVGNISRQEQVSMIPPLLLDVRPEHTVLDLCAAPGSKSAQLIEAIHAGEEDRVETAIAHAKAAMNRDDSAGGTQTAGDEDGGRSSGLLVANDVNYQRAQMLVHQVKRLNSPNLIVTNHDATLFPSIALSSLHPGEGGQEKFGKYLKFDRILADVPCSGDGTCRKNPGIWKEWSPQNGLGLYITQVRILTRALQMLKVGGRVVYSTCSMNPVEDEAVVSSAVERCGGVAKVAVLDCSKELPGLIRSPGLTDWSIMSRNGRIYESFAEAEQYEGEESKVVPGMFAPEPGEGIPLQHCMRVYPHQQDTGAFFIAVLEKLSEIRTKPETESKSGKRTDEHQNGVSSSPGLKRKAEENLAKDAKKPRRQNGADLSTSLHGEDGHEPDHMEADNEHGHGEMMDDEGFTNDATDGALEPLTQSALPTPNLRSRKHRYGQDDPPNEESFKYLPSSHPELQSIFEFYDIHPSFPRDRFLVRNPAGDPVKGIYYSSALAKEILTANEGRGMKFVHGGVKMFVKQDVQGQDGVCRWRIQSEGLPILEGWVGDGRTVRCWRKSTLRKLAVEMFPRVGQADDPKAGWRELGEVGPQVLGMGMGCCVLRVGPRPADHRASDDEGDGQEEELTEHMVCPLWRSLYSVNLMLPKEERKAMLLRVFNEEVDLVNHSDPRVKREMKAEKDEDEGSSTLNHGEAYSNSEMKEKNAGAGADAPFIGAEADTMVLEGSVENGDAVDDNKMGAADVIEEGTEKISEPGSKAVEAV